LLFFVYPKFDYSWMGGGRDVAKGRKDKGMSGTEEDEGCRRGDGGSGKMDG
jgi:hypothetical protein